MSDRSATKLEQLAAELKQSLGIIQKQDIQLTAKTLDLPTTGSIRVGDDCAAIPDGDGYLLLAAEGMWHVLVESDPWFAGWCAVMVNVSDIAAMGGRAIAVVDTIWTEEQERAVPILAGMKAASEVYNVPIIGGHTNFQSAYNALSVAILGRANKLITSFDARPGDLLAVAIDLRGAMHPRFSFWNAATKSNPTRLRADLAILPDLAERDLCQAGKDISMGGVVGTLLMLIEASGCGAVLNLDKISRPQKVPLATWLLSFPSYGFLLSIPPENIAAIEQKFTARNIDFAVVGEVKENSQLWLESAEKSVCFWDWRRDKFLKSD